ncbi:hypothetical protein [Seinonella peptonophila]|uniref:hypothetical protein n=1 Tax=Seinonella peptonophila TaxID=112248 RepID=UPI001114A970|nr:hypothetical protein [Seinonella peptonophila]
MLSESNKRGLKTLLISTIASMIGMLMIICLLVYCIGSTEEVSLPFPVVLTGSIIQIIIFSIQVSMVGRVVISQLPRQEEDESSS